MGILLEDFVVVFRTANEGIFIVAAARLLSC
jgi:hypothetical protein